MALPAQSLTQVVEEIQYTNEATWPGIRRSAFDTSVLAQIFFARPSDPAYGSGPMIGRGHKVQEGGIKVRQRHEFGRSPNTKRMSGMTDTFTTATADLARISEANWRQYNDAATVFDYEVLTNSGQYAVADVATERLNNATLSLVELMLQDLVNGTLPTALTGLDTLIGANDTVQGLAATAGNYVRFNSWGVSGKNTAPASISFASGSFAVRGLTDMQDAVVNATYNTIKPHVICMDENVIQFFRSSLVPQERYSMPTKSADPMIPNLSFYEIPVYSDIFVTSGVIYFLNLDHISYVALSGADFEKQEPIRAGNQEATSTEIQGKGQMVIGDRRYQNKLTGVTA
jgi:hypothetical protein